MATWLLALVEYAVACLALARAMAEPAWQQLGDEILLAVAGIGLAFTVAMVSCTRFVCHALSARRRRVAAVTGGAATKA